MAVSRMARLENDILKTKAKIAEYQGKLKGLEQKRRDVENMEIVDIVRGLKIPLDQLAEFLQSIKNGGATSGQVDSKLNDNDESEADFE